MLAEQYKGPIDYTSYHFTCLWTCSQCANMFVCLLQYYEMSYGLNVEMHKQVNIKISCIIIIIVLVFECMLKVDYDDTD